MTRMLVGQAQPRCFLALRFGENLLTRCLLKPGHNGPHQGRHLKKNPYARIGWYKGDSREFLTDKNYEFAWSERKKHDG